MIWSDNDFEHVHRSDQSTDRFEIVDYRMIDDNKTSHVHLTQLDDIKDRIDHLY